MGDGKRELRDTGVEVVEKARHPPQGTYRHDASTATLHTQYVWRATDPWGTDHYGAALRALRFG